MTTRNLLRRQMRDRRRALTADLRQQAAQSLVAVLTSQAVYHSARHIAAYVAVEGELDPMLLLLRAHEDGKQLYLPVLQAKRDAPLGFFRYTPGIALQPNRLGIPEPPVSRGGCISPQSLDLVLTPLVAFDGNGHRLGMGGGFYDRSFAFLRTGAVKPMLLGLAYEFQRLEQLHEENWDVALAGVATERRCYFFDSRETKPACTTGS
ncbi:MAG: 5-formyltetrahydrofolate cyclo-ligase [Gammaproteobacteria bacterium]|nr:5-formyltetrahydrofolate cyclo-ligase [Gammaproteobacteria bacterium]